MRASVANFYRDNFTRIWWAVAGGLLVGAIVLLGANQIKIRDTANRAEHASQVAQAASEDAAHAIVRIQHERSERIAAQDAINLVVCQGNDEQDQLLAGLLGVTLIAAGEDFSARGEFEAAIKRLRSKPNCTEIVKNLTPEEGP